MSVRDKVGVSEKKVRRFEDEKFRKGNDLAQRCKGAEKRRDDLDDSDDAFGGMIRMVGPVKSPSGGLQEQHFTPME